MLGKHHLSITTGFFIPILVFGLYEDTIGHITYFYYTLYFLASVPIGALLPDADSAGKSALYYRYEFVYYLMIPIYKLIIMIFNNQKIKEKLKVGYNVYKKHRGILHSPIGVFLSSIILTAIFGMAYILISIYLNNNIDIVVIVLVFLGLFLGQLMHLIEDSFTVSGINWLFPFGKKEVNGKIYTFEKIKGKIDVRPDLYTYFYWAMGFILLIALFLNIFPIDKYELLCIGMGINIIGLIGMYFISNTDMNLWLVNKKAWVKMNRKAIKNLENMVYIDKPKKRKKN